MDVITDQFKNISVDQLYTKLSSKYPELFQVESMKEFDVDENELPKTNTKIKKQNRFQTDIDIEA